MSPTKAAGCCHSALREQEIAGAKLLRIIAAGDGRMRCEAINKQGLSVTKAGSLLPNDDAIAAVAVDQAGRVLEATTAAAAILGRRPADLTGRDLDALVVAGWNWVVRNALAQLAAGSLRPFELLLLGRSGRSTLVRMIPQRRLQRSPADDRLNYLLLWIEQRRVPASGEPVIDSEALLRREAYGLLKTHEADLGRVASELHDGVAPLVAMTKFTIEHAIERAGRGEVRVATELMVGAVLRLREVLAEIRRITTDLRPSSLNDLGLLPTIEWHCRSVSEACPQLHLISELAVDEAAIPQELKLDIFRIIQEALNNVVRHSRASEARVSMRVAEERLALLIEDDGAGFDMDSVLHRYAGSLGVGLLSIVKRVDATCGTLQLDSRKGGGTRIGANWPLARRASAR